MSLFPLKNDRVGVSRDGKGALSLFEEAKRSIHVTVDAQLVCAVLVACKNSLRGADAAKGLDIYREYFTSIECVFLSLLCG